MSASSALDIFVGPLAARHLEREGWRGRDVSMLVGASGGPKWLILGHLDRVLFSEFLLNGRSDPLRTLGSSVGSWRHACLALPDPVAAIERFEDVYFHQEYSESPDAAEISTASREMLRHILGQDGAAQIIGNPRVKSYIVTARGRGMTSSQQKLPLLLAMGGAAILNAANRKLLNRSFQRVVFATDGDHQLGYRDFNSQQVQLRPETLPAALHASGSIPFVLSGEADIEGAPLGHYWDGGILDYHYAPDDLRVFAEHADGLVLYPHFRSDITPGWFDKFLPWRRWSPTGIGKLVLMSPSPEFIASLPLGKIPDRRDFTRMTTAQRLTYWRECINRSKELAEAFSALLESQNPLEGVTVLNA